MVALEIAPAFFFFLSEDSVLEPVKGQSESRLLHLQLSGTSLQWRAAPQPSHQK